MNCNRCNLEMIEGKGFIDSGGELIFKAEEWSKHVMLEGSDLVPAHYCDGCGALTLETGRRGLSTLEEPCLADELRRRGRALLGRLRGTET